MKEIQETLITKVTKSCDVLVCGGGFAGIAAALAAARSGKKVILTDKLYILGGLGTAGLIAIYLPICDGYGKQVSFGLAEELLKMSVEHIVYHNRGTDNWLLSDDPAHRTVNDPRYQVEYNPHVFAISAEQALLKEGVEILYGTSAVAAATESCGDGKKITAVIMENKSGRFGIEAKSYVDCTGDADLGVFAGAPTELCGVKNKLASWYYYYAQNKISLKMLGYIEMPDAERMEAELKSGKKGKVESNVRYQGVDGDEISRFMQDSHASILNDVLICRKEDETHEPVTMASMPQLRMTRRVSGAYTETQAELHKYFEDSIGMIANWRKRGPVYEVPFRTLYAPEVKNLIFAGRCISTADDLWELMRVIPCCSVTGEAAGLAAAMTDDFTTLDVAALQTELRARGVVIHEDDLENKAKYE